MRTLSSLLCQPAPDTAKTTKLRAMRTQACIPQLLHTNETSENLRNALYALFIHCLRLSAGPSATRGVRGLTYWAPARGHQVKSPTKTTPACGSGGSDDRPSCSPHRVGFGASYPHFAIFIRAPALGRSGRASGGRSCFLTAKPPASNREGASHHVTRARAYRTAARARRRWSPAKKVLQGIRKHQR